MMKSLCGKQKNPAWLFCLPLLHMLAGVCAPFEVIRVDFSHSNKEPKWWGTDFVDQIVNLFKACNGKWTM